MTDIASFPPTGLGSHERPFRGQTDDWITPKWLVEALGPFDLDPCASVSQPWPCADREFTVEDDGLRQPWEGFVWLNPPYGPQTGRWLGRLADHGDGIALVFARTETEWFTEQVWARAAAVLFIEGRLTFLTPGGARARGNAGAPSCLVAYGDRALARLLTAGLRGTVVAVWQTYEQLVRARNGGGSTP